jgi:hypothetical protein
MDLDRVAIVTSVDGKGNEHGKNFSFQLGALSSALEHAVPEQMFVTPENPGEAVSAVKALQKAAQQGQRIYHITQANQATALPNIRQSSLTMSEIRAALAVGKEVSTHTDPITVPGWKGAGYVITDPETGAGAWKIGGGANGGSMQSSDDLFGALLDWLIPQAYADTMDGAAKSLGRAGTLMDANQAMDDCNNASSAIRAFITVALIGWIASEALALLLAAGPLGLLIFVVALIIISAMVWNYIYETDPACSP